MEFIISQRGKRVCLHGGFRYKHDRLNRDGSNSWRCMDYNRRCLGRIKAHADGRVESVTPHNHAPDEALNDVERAKAEIRDRASNSVEKPRQVVINCTTGLSDEAAVLMPKYSASQRRIERKRKLEGVQMPAPSALRDIAIPAPLMLTHRNENFLLWDSGTEDASRIIMFGTRGNLQVLEDNPLNCSVFMHSWTTTYFRWSTR